VSGTSAASKLLIGHFSTNRLLIGYFLRTGFLLGTLCKQASYSILSCTTVYKQAPYRTPFANRLFIGHLMQAGFLLDTSPKTPYLTLYTNRLFTGHLLPNSKLCMEFATAANKTSDIQVWILAI
jgi:hypothetical protein